MCKDCLIEGIKGWIYAIKDGLGIEYRDKTSATEELAKSRRSYAEALKANTEAYRRLTAAVENLSAAIKEEQ